MKRYVRLGYEIAEGQDIENATQNLAGTRIANLEPNRDDGLYTTIKKTILFQLFLFSYINCFFKNKKRKEKTWNYSWNIQLERMEVANWG